MFRDKHLEEIEAMRRVTAILAVALVLVALAGCNTAGRQPRFDNAMIRPPDAKGPVEELKPGDTAVISVQVKDKHDIVRRVEGVVREDDTIKFKLRDDGVEPDEEAGDNIWSLQVDVPFLAPAGEFLLEITAYRSDGTPVPVRNEEGRTVAMTASIPVVIVNP